MLASMNFMQMLNSGLNMWTQDIRNTSFSVWTICQTQTCSSRSMPTVATPQLSSSELQLPKGSPPIPPLVDGRWKWHVKKQLLNHVTRAQWPRMGLSWSDHLSSLLINSERHREINHKASQNKQQVSWYSYINLTFPSSLSLCFLLGDFNK